QFDDAAPFAPQVAALVAATGLTAEEWQTLPLLVNLPTYAPIAAVLLAYLHGLCGHFPFIVRLRPNQQNGPPSFEIAETIRLDTIRDSARRERGK
ncbi:MAG TPA: CRISPR-associated protein Csx15, partial [Dehalococcoidia bacterium]|nr:CRISPR-associated protein Csx15 [Dehalococcoidia bacterium]